MRVFVLWLAVGLLWASGIDGLQPRPTADAQQTGEATGATPTESYSYVGDSAAHQAERPLEPSQAARSMKVPEGFRVTLFAGEPDVKQPISFCLDDRGRVWVAEAYNYPVHGTTPGDRIVILEDRDGDGTFDLRKVFFDQLNYVTGIEVGFGGAWVMSPPYFYFIPDRDGDDVPDGSPEILLDGFGNHANSHNVANGLAWGPDGWLYGTHGRTNWSLIGAPGSAAGQRVRFDGGVYRYHPVRRVWEPFADGTTNPWGIDWNDVGDAFVCNCVNPHLFQVIQGAHYEPWRNRESSQYAYQRIDTIADHLHYIGAGEFKAGIGTVEEDLLGGGHAHCGTLVYLGNNWPDSYRNTILMNNIHGRRINNDLPRRSGSGYVASHGPDLMKSQDPWYMGVTLLYGPDGAVFASDWSDTGECHSVTNTRRQTGRIYKISYDGPTAATQPRPVVGIDLARYSNDQLVELQLHKNDWFVRHARRLLQERAARGDDLTSVHRQLLLMLRERPETPRKLRALWALFVTGGLETSELQRWLLDDDEYLRGWAVRLLSEDSTPGAETLAMFRKRAEVDPSSYVRLQLASALQRFAFAARWDIATALMQHAEDEADQNLPLMIWYAIAPLIDDDSDRFVDLAEWSRLSLVRRHVARRASGADDAEGTRTNRLVAMLADLPHDSARVDLLTGMQQGLLGRRQIAVPPAWPDTYARLSRAADADSRLQTLLLRFALLVNDPNAVRELRRQVANTALPAAVRREALEALMAKQVENLPALLLALLDGPTSQAEAEEIQRTALRGLADFDAGETPTVILRRYSAFSPLVRVDAIQTLTARPSWANQLLDAVETGAVPRQDLSAYAARQLSNLRDRKIEARVRALWGEVRVTPAEKVRRIHEFKRRLTPELLATADLAAGHRLYQDTCAKCHRLFGSGENVGPDITGAQRSNLDYLLENLIDPSASVSRDFQMQVVTTSSGRTLTGLLIGQADGTLQLRTLNETVTLPLDEVETREQSDLSMMPEGMLDNLTLLQVRDLIAYLQAPRPVD